MAPVACGLQKGTAMNTTLRRLAVIGASTTLTTVTHPELRGCER